MIRILFFNILWLPMLVSADGIDFFAQKSIESMRNKDSSLFKEYLFSESLSEKDILYVFNKYSVFFNNEGGVKYSMRRLSDLSSSVECQYSNILLFYKGELPKNLTWSFVENSWGRNVLGVEVDCVDGEWKVSGTPFYMYRHAPWAGDYG